MMDGLESAGHTHGTWRAALSDLLRLHSQSPNSGFRLSSPESLLWGSLQSGALFVLGLPWVLPAVLARDGAVLISTWTALKIWPGPLPASLLHSHS